MSEQLELDLDDTEEEQTEEGLDKFVKRNEERRQKEYEENKYRNRELQRRQQERDNQQLEIPDMFKAGSTARTLTGLGVEIGGNFLLDAFSFVPGSQQAGSAALNYLQQVIRGGPISKGEILAAAAASQIPFLQQAKAATRGGKFLRGVAKGSTAGAIDSSVRPIIDEKRAPTVGEFATGVTAGGAFGGMFDLAPAFTKGGARKVGQELGEITKDGQKFLRDLGEVLTPGPVRVMRGDLIGAVADGVGSSSNITKTVTMGFGDEFTQKFIKQPWEDFSNTTSGSRLLSQITGFGTKLSAPQPKGNTYTILRSTGPGNQPRTIVKDDIDLTKKKDFKFDKPEQVVESAKKFRRMIIRLMQVDRIRGEDAGTLAEFTRNPTKVKTAAGGLEDIGKTYYDYLVGYFNRYIRRGTVDNFKEAVALKIPKIRGGQVLPELDTVQGNVSLVRELRLFTMAPDVYDSGAFKVKSPSYQAKLKTLIRKYSSVDAPKTYNERRNIFEYKFDAHHIDQVAEGWPLYRGLPKEEIPVMRALLRSFGLEPGNHDDNVLLLLNKFHKDYHNIYWPKAYAKLKAHPDGWDIDKIRDLQTASARLDYARRYAEAINESRDEVVEAINRNLDELAAKKNKTRAQLTEAEVDKISLDLEDIGDEVPADIAAQMAEDAGINDVTRWRDYEN